MFRTVVGERDHAVAAVVGAVALLGATALVGTAWAAGSLAAPDGSPAVAALPVVAAFVVAAAVGERLGVHVLHGDQREDLTFFEIIVVASFLVLSPVYALAAPLLGLAVSQVVVRRPFLKQTFNLGSYAAATAAAYLAFVLVAGGDPRFSTRGVLGLVVGMTVFAVINTALLAVILRVTIGLTVRETVADFWTSTLLMIGASIGVGAMSVAVAPVSPALVPFVLVPALALAHAYRTVAAQRQARERNAWLVTLSGVLTEEGSLNRLLESVSPAVCGAFDASCIELLLADADVAPYTDLLDEVPVALPRELLPAGWTSGVAAVLDLGAGRRAAMLLGSDRGRGRGRSWSLDPEDAPVLITVAASIASAIRSIDHREALSAESSKLKAVVENASDGIVVIADTGDVRLWSPAMARITGVSATDAQDATASAAPVLAALRELTSRRRLVAVADAEATSDLTVARPDGEARDLSVSVVRARPTAAGEKLTILTVHDVTSQARADRLKADFVATISHELRTPLTPIKGYAQLLRAKGDAMTPERRAAALDLIAERADHMGRLVEDLLMASRASGTLGSKLATAPSVHDLRDIVQDAASNFPALADRLVVEATAEPVAVFCDEVRTVQILSNLLSNAGKYSPAGTPITLRVCPTEFADTHVRVQVVDQGFGLGADDLERVFERFYRVEDSLTMRTSGSGLGLYIARELAAVMDGELAVTSTVGAGSTFTLSLPRSAAATSATHVPSPRTA